SRLRWLGKNAVPLACGPERSGWAIDIPLVIRTAVLAVAPLIRLFPYRAGGWLERILRAFSARLGGNGIRHIFLLKRQWERSSKACSAREKENETGNSEEKVLSDSFLLD